MKRIAIYGALVFLIVLAVASLIFSTHFRAQELTPAQFHIKPPVPPEDPCYELDRAMRAEPVEAKSKQPVKNAEELGSDEIAFYRILIGRWSSGERVKVSSKTFPLELDRIDCACFKGVDPAAVLAASHTYRHLTRDVLPGKHAILVSPGFEAAHIRDPHEGMQQGERVEVAVNKAFENGLFSLSQIALDKEHSRAIVSYSFYCGSTCGNGYTMLFEKVKGEWKETDRTCGGYIS